MPEYVLSLAFILKCTKFRCGMGPTGPAMGA